MSARPTKLKNTSAFLLQEVHWSDLIASTDTERDWLNLVSENERKRREAVWELFKSECVFLIDHLMVLKHVRHFLFMTFVWLFAIIDQGLIV